MGALHVSPALAAPLSSMLAEDAIKAAVNDYKTKAAQAAPSSVAEDAAQTVAQAA